ncbi:hypothetical protein CsSME_00007709 [Camellia sinensis var. sinensis]
MPFTIFNQFTIPFLLAYFPFPFPSPLLLPLPPPPPPPPPPSQAPTRKGAMSATRCSLTYPSPIHSSLYANYRPKVICRRETIIKQFPNPLTIANADGGRSNVV